MRRLAAAIALGLGLGPGAWLAAAAATQPAHAHVRIPGTGVQLLVPEGFRIAEGFAGIGRDEDATSLLVTELDVPFAISREDLGAERLAARGVDAHRTVEVEVAGREGVLVHGTQRAAGVRFRKWLLLFGDERRSVLLTATTPLDLEAVHRDALVGTLSSARWTPEPEADAEPAPPFRIPEAPPLALVRSASNALVLAAPAREGRLPPLVTIGVSQATVQIRDLPGFARDRLEQSASIEAPQILEQHARDLDGLPGHWIRARATDARSRRPVEVAQLLATDGERYFLVQAIADAEDGDRLEAPLEALLAGFRRER